MTITETPPATKLTSTPTRSTSRGSASGQDHLAVDTHPPTVLAGPILFDPTLKLLAVQLDALEDLRKATANRHRAATRDATDADGEMRGWGLSADDPAVRQSAAILADLERIEHQGVLALQRAMRAHPLGAWQRATLGVGEKTLARLLGCIGDPYWNTAADKPRTVSALWAYCGLHTLPAGGDVDPDMIDTHMTNVNVAARRSKGQRANWSTAAKTRIWLIAEACVKNTRSPYRAVYDDARTKYAEAVHAVDCAQCGHAKAGTPLSLGHQHARAMRLMCKEILKDLWREARRLHGAGEDVSE